MKRLLTFIFGLMAYAVFLVTVLYSIGFLGDLFVQKTIDSGSNANPVVGFILDIGLIALFGFQHSLMARRSFKEIMWWLIPEAAERSLFVLCASLCLFLLYWQWRAFTGELWNFPEGSVRIILLSLYGLGWLIAILSTFLIDHFDFTGLRQVYFYLMNREYASAKFSQRLFYKIVRHPMMLGLLMCFWFTPRMTLGHLIFAGGMSIYILIGLAFEEKDLLRDFGDVYRRYRKQVPMLIPINLRHLFMSQFPNNASGRITKLDKR